MKGPVRQSHCSSHQPEKHLETDRLAPEAAHAKDTLSISPDDLANCKLNHTNGRNLTVDDFGRFGEERNQQGWDSPLLQCCTKAVHVQETC